MDSATTSTAEPGVRRARPLTFAMIFAGESLLRATNVTVIPLQAYDLLGSSQRVSMVSTSVSFCVLLTTLFLPLVFTRFPRQVIYTAGVGLIITAALIFAVNIVPGQILAHYLRNTGAAVISVSLQLYIMDNIRRAELTTSEPLRLAVSTVSWVIGPVTGAWLYTNYGPWGAQLAVVAAGIVHYIGFRFARLQELPRPKAAASRNNPLSNVLEFARSPRLRLAWLIAFGRSAYWASLFTYGPLLMVQGGLGKSAGGLLVSFSQFVLPVSIVYGRLASRWGVRPVISMCFAFMALAMSATAFFGKLHPEAAAACLVLGALCTTGLDGVGGIPFLRSVRPSQRQRLTSVYRTFLECSDLIPGFVFMFLLLFFDLEIVFLTISLLMTGLSFLSWRYLPKSM